MKGQRKSSRKANGKPFARVDDKRFSHLGGDWSSPVESLVSTDDRNQRP